MTGDELMIALAQLSPEQRTLAIASFDGHFGKYTFVETLEDKTILVLSEDSAGRELHVLELS